MAARDRWDFELHCPQCGAIGRAEVSENDYPFMRSTGFSVDSIEGSFRVKKLGVSSISTSIECTACEIEATR